MDFIKIDGSFGEGGGQILRTSLTLSIVTGKPFEMVNIRAKRENPGLRPQHLWAVRSAAIISSADVKGDEIGSQRLRFIPGEVTSGEYEFNIGTAGSTSLLLQTIFIPLALKGNYSSTVTVRGGTHVPWSPSFECLEGWLDFLKRMGFKGSVSLKRAGFYPKGGGEIRACVEPVREVQPIRVEERGELVEIYGISAVAGLPIEVARRGKERVFQLLEQYGVPLNVEVKEVPSSGQGAFIFLKGVFKNTVAYYDVLGEKGKRMEKVAEEACYKLIGFINSGATVDEKMGDQLIVPLSLAEGNSCFRVPYVTNHMKTNVEVVKEFLDNIEISIKEDNKVIIEKNVK
jgi:RNA 3'-terminal phosphate cyclase (ATP)